MLSSWDDEKAELKLVDFGCSVIVNKTPDRGPLTPSTIAYDPPEKLIHRSPPNFASDVWAAGCILYIGEINSLLLLPIGAIILFIM